MKKICLRCAGFLLILALFLGILSAVFYPKGRGYNDGLENPRIWAFQAEPENSLEVLAIGDSLLMCGYSPLDVWTQRGYTGFGCCTGNQRLTQSLRMLEAFCANLTHHLADDNFDMLIVDFNALQTVNLLDFADQVVLGSNAALDSQDILRDRVLPLIPALEYHDNWKIFSPKGFLRAPDYSYLHPQKGTHFLYDRDPQVPEEADSYMEDLGEQEPIAGANRRYFQKIARFCQEKGIRLVLVSVPSPSNWSYARHSAVQTLAEHYGLTYLDMNLEDLGIDWYTDKSTEGDHLNYLGTQKVSAFLGDYLASTGLLESHRQDDLGRAWEQAAQAQAEKNREKLEEAQ